MLPLLLLPPAAHGALGNVSKPHILFALVDDLGWNDVGWHDSFGQIQTPKLNKLRLDSVELSQYYVYRYCSPSRSTILTGRFPWHLGQQTEMNLNPTPGIACGISPAYSFLPSVLQRAGYATWALGKWHLGFLNDTYTPTLRGFDRYLGYYSGAEEHFTHEKVGFPAPHGEKGGFTAYDLANNSGPHVAPCVEPVGNGSATYSSFLYGNETLRLLAQHDPSIPLYVYLAWNNVHDPNEAPQQYVDLHDRIADVPRRKLSAMMSVLDDTLTAVIEAFKAKHMWDDTLFIFSTDNGGNLGGSGVNWPLRGGKYTFWQGGVRGVGLVGGGANILPDALRGSTWSGFVSQADWYSTFAALAGVTLDDTGPLPADGLNVFPAIIVNGSSPREEVPLQIWSTAEGNRVAPPPRDFCERFAGTDEGERCRPPTSVHAPDSAVARKRWRAAAAWHSHSHTQVEETELVSVRLGAIIRGRWKLIWGYPGWTKNWDGWIRAPGTTRGPKESHGDRRIASAGRAVPLLKPYNGTLCVKMPCLFDILSDPTEHHDVGDQHPQVVASLKARIQELMASEVTVEEAELCPTKMGSLPDPRGTAVAVASGFWQPWLNANA